MDYEKIIYTKRFKKEFAAEEPEISLLPADKSEKPSAEKIRCIKTDRSPIVFKSYIELSKKLSEALEADIDIIQTNDCCKVMLYIGKTAITGESKNLLSFMFMTCDEAYIDMPADLLSLYKYMIEFVLYTHGSHGS